MEKTLYHGTPKNNIFSIMREGIRAGIDGIVYFCETPGDSLRYMWLYAAATKTREFAVIPVTFTNEELANMGKNVDNSAELPTAYAYYGNITADRIPKDLNEILLYVLK